MKLKAIVLAIAVFALPFAAVQAWEGIPLQVSIVPGAGLPFGSGGAAVSIGLIGAINDSIDFIQLSSLFNVAGEARGLQAAGVFNIASRRLDGIQLGGVFNIGNIVLTPMQGAGVFNIAHNLIGFQAAGLFNIADTVYGVQAASLFNVAKDLRGLQVGLVNVADRVDGIQIGLLNFSSNGIGDLGFVWTRADGYLNASWKTGRNGLYFVYGAGTPMGSGFADPDRLLLNAGIGSRMGSSRAPHIDVDLRAEQYIGPDHIRFRDGILHRNGLTPLDVIRPYPSVNLCIGIPIGPLTLIGGAKIDVDLAAAPWMPESLRRGLPYTNTWFGAGFTTWTKFFFGLSI
jgi:hypothetical protein